MIVAFPLSLSPASSSAATRKRKKKTKTRKCARRDASQTRPLRCLAASSIVPIVLLLLQNLLLRVFFFFFLHKCIFLHAAFPLSSSDSVFRIIYRFLRVRFPHRFALGRLLSVVGVGVEHSFAHLVDDFVRLRGSVSTGTWSDISRRNDTQSSQYAFWALFFSSFKVGTSTVSPKTLSREASSKSSFLPKTALATAKRQRKQRVQKRTTTIAFVLFLRGVVVVDHHPTPPSLNTHATTTTPRKKRVCGVKKSLGKKGRFLPMGGKNCVCLGFD